MIEQIMFFLLGAFSVGLLFLMLLPAISSRAMRLSRQRLEMLLPLSMEEVVAERDLLRAEFAAERRRLEQRMEAQAAVHASELAELGRRASEIVGLKADLTKLRADHGDLSARYETVVRDLAEANGERGALITELHDATGLHDTIRGRFEALTDAHAALGDLSEDRRVAIVALETKTEGLTAQIADVRRDLAGSTRKAANEEERARGLGEERDMLLKEMQSVQQLMTSTQARFEAERTRAAALQDAIETQRKDMDEALLMQRDAQKALEAAERARQNADELAQMHAQRIASQIEASRAAENSAADQIEELRAEIAALRGALGAARAGHAGARPLANTAGLREAIADIGAKVAQMAEGPRAGE